MDVKDGDFAKAVEALSKRQPGAASAASTATFDTPPNRQASHSSLLPFGPASRPAPDRAATDAQELAAHGLVAHSPIGASTLFAPSVQEIEVLRPVLRSRSRRVLRTAAAFALVFVAALVYVGFQSETGAGRDAVFAVLFALQGLLPAWVWFRSRHVRVDSVCLHGFHPRVLARVAVWVEGFWVAVEASSEDEDEPCDALPLSGHSQGGTTVAPSTARDQELKLFCLLVRAKPGTPQGAAHPPLAVRAVQEFCAALAQVLGVAPSQVRATHPELSDDVEDLGFGAITYVSVLVRGGQAMHIETVCRGIQAAAADVEQRYTFELDE